MNKTYDLIVSLGANCSAAHNILIRGLRPCSLPFDWCFFVDGTPLQFWIDEAGCGFPNFLKKENLMEILPCDKNYAPSHPDVKQYLDIKSGYYFVNHFLRAIDEAGEYELVYAKLRRRIDRLSSAFEHGGTFLLLLATEVDVSEMLLSKLVKSLSTKFPKSHFDLRYLHFKQLHNSENDLGNGIVIENVSRAINDYDFLKTNWEWHFLDEISLSAANKGKKHFKISFNVWPSVRCNITFKRKK